MGSRGMSRKGRQHLPKVGTKPEREYAQEHERESVVDNFGLHVESHTATEIIGAILVAVLVVLGAVSLAMFT